MSCTALHWLAVSTLLALLSVAGCAQPDMPPIPQAERMLDALGQANLPCRRCVEKDLSPMDLQNQRVLFVHSDLSHDGVLFERRQFCTFLKASALEPLTSAKTSSVGH